MPLDQTAGGQLARPRRFAPRAGLKKENEIAKAKKKLDLAAKPCAIANGLAAKGGQGVHDSLQGMGQGPIKSTPQRMRFVF
jgi:hypothetical protein